MGLTDDQIRHLIACRKIISKPPKRRLAAQGRHQRNDFELVSEEGAHKFSAFMRQSMEFPENFSIGLVYVSSEDGSRTCLLRCNGPHGEVHSLPSTPDHHFRYHIHIATEDALQQGLRPESSVSATNDYSTFEEACVYFIRTCGILEPEKYFAYFQPEIDRQLGLFEDKDD